jgi:hypothetical protein
MHDDSNYDDEPTGYAYDQDWDRGRNDAHEEHQSTGQKPEPVGSGGHFPDEDHRSQGWVDGWNYAAAHDFAPSPWAGLMEVPDGWPYRMADNQTLAENVGSVDQAIAEAQTGEELERVRRRGIEIGCWTPKLKENCLRRLTEIANQEAGL